MSSRERKPRAPRTRQALAAKSQQTAAPTSRILLLPDIVARTGKSESTIRNWERQGLFPSRIRTGPRSVGWRESDFDAWLASRPTGFNARATDFGVRP